jgi:lipid-A-disaccharide synthase
MAGAGGPLIFVIAGEPSGDLLGARLMAALKQRTGGRVRFAGIGGEEMRGQGLDSLSPMAELTVMGLVEVLPRLPNLIRRITQTVAAVRRLKPDALVTIDSPGFNFRVARRLKGEGVPLIHYVAPSVWAWRAGRARTIASFLDHLLVLLPFEPPLFERQGLATSFVGHPAIESSGHADGAGFRRAHAIAADAPLLAVLPGSRGGEVARLLPVFEETLRRLVRRLPNLTAVVATVEPVAAAVQDAVAAWPLKTVIVRDGADRAQALAAADAALAASGTITLELAVARTPMVVAYRMAPLTMALARRLVRVRYATLINLVLDRPAIPEFIQQACRAEALAGAVEKLLVDPGARAAQIEAMQSALGLLGGDGPEPSLRAADAVLAVIAAAPRRTEIREGRR